MMWKNERGTTLIELVIVIIVLGLALPSLLSLMGLVSLHSARNGVMETAVTLAEAKMEEIIGIKETHWDWYKNADQFVEEDVNLGDQFSRQVTVKQISDWGEEKLNAWEVVVRVDHPQLENGYSLTMRFTRYQIK
ncbi:MAG: type II secretion system protein [Calditrichia bacterium]